MLVDGSAQQTPRIRLGRSASGSPSRGSAAGAPGVGRYYGRFIWHEVGVLAT
jgi:hypothetical protein